MTIKRAFDIVLSVFGIVLAAAPLALMALAVRLTSPGPVLHWSRRVGRDNQIFRMPKFRTMRTDTPQLATHLLTDARRWITWGIIATIPLVAAVWVMIAKPM